MQRKFYKFIFFVFLFFTISFAFFPSSPIIHGLASSQLDIGKGNEKMTTRQSPSEEELEQTIEQQLNQLDLKELEEYINSLSGFSDVSIAEQLVAYIQGEKFDYENFAGKLFQLFFNKISQILPAFLSIIAIALLTGLLSTLQSGVLKGGANIVFLISYAAALVPLFVVLVDCIAQTKNCVLNLQKQMQLIYPLLITLMATSGAGITAAVCQPAVAFFSNTIVSLIVSFVFPLSITIIVLSMASNLSKELKISKMATFFKSINKWIIGLSVSLFGLFFTLQGISAASYDGIARRLAKYAIGNGVPIIGGFLSGGFDLAVAGSILIKNSLGTLGIFLMVFILLEPLLLLVAFDICLRLTSAITQPFGDSKISDFLGETAENLHYFTAGLLFTGFLYFMTIVLMIYSTEGLF